MASPKNREAPSSRTSAGGGAITQDRIIVRGQTVYVDFPCKTWTSTGWRFQGRDRTKTDLITAHWTGGENAPGVVFNALDTHAVYKDIGGVMQRVEEPLSIHFVVDQAGVVYQMADTEMACMHARGVNDRSIGIEFISRGSDLTKPTKGWTRPRAAEVIHGRKVSYDEMLPAQMTVGVALIETLCKLYKLPMRVPEDLKGAVLLGHHPDIAKFRGVIGHLHVPGTTKYDCGAGLLRAVRARGKAMAAVPVA